MRIDAQIADEMSEGRQRRKKLLPRCTSSSLSLSPRSSTPKLSQNAGTDLSPSFLSVLISFDVIEREYRLLLRTVSPLDGNSTQPLVLLLRA